MKATTVLIEEHGGIRVILRVLEKINQEALAGKDINTGHLSRIVEFLQIFADKCHHGKEETILIPAVSKLNIEDPDHLIQTILDEHNQARLYTKGIKDSVESYSQGDTKAVRSLVENGQAYIKLLDQHINKENLTFFPRADRVLSEDDQNRMYEDFERLEIEMIGEGTHERLHGMIEELDKIYLQQA